MGRTAVLSVRIIGDGSQARQELDRTGGRLDRFKSGLDKVAIPAAAAGAAALAFAKKTGDMASVAQQNAGAVDQVFGKTAAKIHEFASSAAENLGLSSSSYEQMATVIGSQLKNMGLPMDKVAGQTQDLIQKGADLSAMFGGTTAEAVDALSSLLRGERDPIERYGVSINQAAIDAQKAAMGLKGLSGEADKNATLQATMALLTKQTSAAQGQFARETTSAAGAQEIANAKMQDAGAKIGAAFLPAMVMAAGIMAQVASWAGQNSDALAILAVVVGSLAAAVLAINGALRIYQAVTTAVTVVQGIFNAVLAANPVVLIVLAIIALVAAVILAYNNIGWFKDFVDGAFKVIGEIIGAVAQWFQDAWNKAVLVVQILIATWGPVITGIINAVANFIGDAVRNIQTWWENAWRGVQLAVQLAIAIVQRIIMAVWFFILGVVIKIQNAWDSAFAFVRGIVDRAMGAVRGAISGVSSFIGGIVGTIRDTLGGAFETARSVAETALAGINGAIQGVIGWVKDAIGWVQSLFGQTNSAKSAAAGLGGATSAAGWLLAPVGLEAVGGGATGYAGGPARFGLSAPKFGSVTNVNVTVQGALDPVAVGRQVRDLVVGSLRSDGRVAAGEQPW